MAVRPTSLFIQQYCGLHEANSREQITAHITGSFPTGEQLFIVNLHTEAFFISKLNTTCVLYHHNLSCPGIESRWGARFSAPVQTSPEAHTATFPEGKATGTWR
jgi:hypothetical protein